MNNKSINSNKQFMIGNGILAFGVFFIVCLFLYLSFRTPQTADQSKTSADLYTIQVENSFAGDSISVYINDSLLLYYAYENMDDNGKVTGEYITYTSGKSLCRRKCTDDCR